MPNVGALGDKVLALQILHLDARGYKNQEVLNIKLADKKTPLFPNNRDANYVRQTLLKRHKRGTLEARPFTLQDRALLADDCRIATKLFELVTRDAPIHKYSPPTPPTDEKMPSAREKPGMYSAVLVPNEYRPDLDFFLCVLHPSQRKTSVGNTSAFLVPDDYHLIFDLLSFLVLL